MLIKDKRPTTRQSEDKMEKQKEGWQKNKNARKSKPHNWKETKKNDN